MGKRKVEVVDLTGDDENSPLSHNKVAKRDAGPARGLPTPPASSQRVSSKNTSSQNEGDDQLDDDDLRRNIRQTNDVDDEVYENYELYGILDTKIVGVRYYNGRATTGEYVMVRREPRHQYDSNAIRIDNVVGDQIGHIGRNVAAKLANLMDTHQLLVEGALTGPKSTFEAPISLKLFETSDPDASAALKEHMQSLRLPVQSLIQAERDRKKRVKALADQQKAREKAAAALQKRGGRVIDYEDDPRYARLAPIRNADSETNPAMEELLSGTGSYNPRDIQDAVNQLGAGEEALSKMDMIDQPDTISTQLLPYQRQGLKWLLDHESPQLPKAGSKDIVQLWKHTSGAYLNIATSFAVTKEPELASGGLLADDMGLGKTLQVLSLIVADPRRAPKQPTLIIAPLSVMSNWSTQANSHIKKKHALNILTYHGQECQGMSAEDLRRYDLVITTYQTMARELFPKGDKPQKVPTARGLFSLQWRRIVLDEGHNIRNPKAKMALAACALQAESRWILTGTPIVNSLKDLFSHVKFLGLTGGLAEFDVFNSMLIRPLKNGDNGARLLLQALMSSVCLRRTKDMKFCDLKLPKLEFHKYPIKFLPHERERYDAFRKEAKGLVEAAKAKKGDLNMTHLLEVLLRLRQTCNHWKMCGEERVNKLLALVEENKIVDIMDPANHQALQDLLRIRVESQEDCPVCIDTFRHPVITACAHAFCRDCIEKVIETQRRCPMCRAELTDAATLLQPTAGMGEDEDENVPEIDADTTSSKIEALIKLLTASEKEGNKTVVFSHQWTSFLDLVQAQLTKRGLTFTRLDGRMNAAGRDVAIETLNTDEDCTIMLASLGVCSVGLNLVAADQVILCDSWWAPAIEDQAVDRVHRLGQTRDCKVVRLIMEESVEDEVLEIQAKKRKLAATAFGEKGVRRGRAEEQAQRLNDINRLLA